MPPHARVVGLLIALHAFFVQAPRAAEPAHPEWRAGDGYRWFQFTPTPSGDSPGFTRLTASELGIAWTNRCSPARYAKRQNLMNGAGVALGDYDGDGWCDLYLCNREGPDALYRNLGGWRFTNVTDLAGVASADLISSGALFADLNGDGHLDLHVTSFLGPDALYLNRGDGTFTNITVHAGVGTDGGGTSSAAADIDGDGDLDLYIARFAVEAMLRDGSVITTRMVGGKPVVSGRAGRRVRIINNRLYELGEPDVLLLNEGGNRFRPVSWTERFRDETGQPLTETPMDLGFAVQLRDINGDGTPDIFVCNDFQTPDRCWLNDGTGHFRALSSLALRNMSYASMGVDFADVDRDGHLDLYTVEMLPSDPLRHLTHIVLGADPAQRHPRDPHLRDAFTRNILGWNRGDGTYAEIAWFAGAATSDWSWTPVFLDVDLDGYEDLLISSGFPHDVNDLDAAGGAGRGEGRALNESFTNQLLAYPPLDPPLVAWRNRGDLTFEDQSAAWRFDVRLVTHGMATADFDNDGDLDVVANAFNAPPLIFRNDAPAPRLAVRLKGRAPNTQGTGARIRVEGTTVIQEQEMLSGGRYLSCDQHQRTFATSGATGPLRIEVRWRDGTVSKLSDVKANTLVEIAQPPTPTPAPSAPPSPALTRAPAPDPAKPLFHPLSTPREFAHQDPEFDELSRQPYLPWFLGFQGPGLLWFDPEGKQRDDLFMANGRGARLLRLRFPAPAPTPAASSSGNDNALNAPTGSVEPLGDPLPDDGLGMLGITLAPGLRSLLMTVANHEAPSIQSSAVLGWDFKDGKPTARPPLRLGRGSPGPIAAGDLDGDGDLDVVVGGRMVSDRYPEAADTAVFRNNAGTLDLDPAASAALAKVGLVTGMLLADLLGDAAPELVVACEWGPIRVFQWEKGVPREQTSALGLDRITGIWQGIAAADFDGDGRTDLVAGNWGRNSHQQRAPAGPWRLFHGDPDGDGRTSIVEAYFHAGLKRMVPVRTRSQLATELPWLPVAFPTHAQFARASVPQILEQFAESFAFVEANTLSSQVLLHRGDRFEPVELPREAQWTPVFGFAAADFDGDGDDDLVCAQNFFGVRSDDDRLDAGIGLLLLNDGRGRFKAASASASGIRIVGEQRAAVAGDFDDDGRLDLAVAQNSGPVALLRNQGAVPGLRLRLIGSPANPDAIGAKVRLLGRDWNGPLREIRAGSGRLSQDSTRLVLGGHSRARQLSVQFPGREPRILDLPADLTREWRIADAE